jgi:transglutaminase-like putative cysteine protease
LAEYISTLDEYASALAELEQSLAVPYTAISGREITWAWKDMDGDIHKWTLSVDGYRGWIELPEPDETVLLQGDYTTYTMVDFRPYVRAEGFSEVIPDLYQECADEFVFAKEVFNLVTQLTVYSEDIGEVPRCPIETLTEAGGDCEDLAILFASLLKAAPYPYKLSLVYIDGDNPTDPQRPNHVIVWVEADDWKLFAECTNDQGWDYYERVVGWYYEL